MNTVYVLKLENSKYYIGIGTDTISEIFHHKNGTKCEWTKIHKPLSIVEVINNCEKYDDLKITFKYMAANGIDNVRSDTFQEVVLNESIFAMLKKNIKNNVTEITKAEIEKLMKKDNYELHNFHWIGRQYFLKEVVNDRGDHDHYQFRWYDGKYVLTAADFGTTDFDKLTRTGIKFNNQPTIIIFPRQIDMTRIHIINNICNIDGKSYEFNGYYFIYHFGKKEYMKNIFRIMYKLINEDLPLVCVGCGYNALNENPIDNCFNYDFEYNFQKGSYIFDVYMSHHRCCDKIMDMVKKEMETTNNIPIKIAEIYKGRSICNITLINKYLGVIYKNLHRNMHIVKRKNYTVMINGSRYYGCTIIHETKKYVLLGNEITNDDKNKIIEIMNKYDQ